MAKFKSEYEALSYQHGGNLNADRAKQRIDLSHKIKALEEERKKLKRLHAKEAQIDELSALVISKITQQRVTGHEKLHEKALWLVRTKQYKDAIRAYEDIALETPDNAENYMLLGHTCMLAGEYVKAEKSFLAAAEINPKAAKAIVPLYNDMILKNPSNGMAHTRLGFAYLILGYFEEARRAFIDALTLDSENIDALGGLEYLDSLRF